MLSRTATRLVLGFLVLCTCLTATGRAAVSDRIAGNISTASRVTLPHMVSPKALAATDVGAAPVSQKLDGMTIRFNMTDAQQASLTQLLSDLQTAGSARYHQWLTPQQFGAQFGLSAADLQKVSSWLTAQGFTVTGVANSSTFITFSGTVGQVQQAFGTSMHTVSLNGELHVANLTDPVLPSAVAGVVSTITGLNDFKLKSRVHKRTMSDLDANATRPRDTINTTAGLEHFIAPGDFYTIYNVTPLLTAGINGTGVTIAVMGQVDLGTADIAAFRTASGLSASTITLKTYGTDPGSPSSACLGNNPPTNCSPSADDLDESNLDVEWAGAVAPSASIIFVTSTDVLSTSLVRAIDNNIAPIMTVSYGACESSVGSADLMAFDAIFSQANAQGITIVGPAGDSGATDCDDNSVQSATNGLAVDFPGSSPHVTSVGGTQFSEGADTATPNGTYWNNTTTSTSSALSYIPEAVWNETASDLALSPTQATLSAGGGGVSVLFPKPVWQTGTGVPNDSFRDVPDVSFNASAAHDPYLTCSEGACVNGTYFTASGNFYPVGGTSVSTPSFAGILALVEQKLGGSRLGNVNPYIYSLANSANYSTIFHDVTVGDNKSPCTIKSPNCTTSPIGYSAGVGYDQATGWGSVNATQFATSLTASVTTLPNTTTTTVTVSPTTISLGAAVTLTATITHTAGAATPTGSVIFSIDNTTNSPAVTLSSSGVATYSTTFTSSATHTVYAYYTSGDSNYYGSAGSTTITVGTVPTGTITLTANPSSTTISSGSNVTSTITVQSNSGYAGTVNLTATAPALNGAYTFTPTSVTLAAGASATSTFTVTSVAAATKGSGQFNRSGGAASLALGGAASLAGVLIFGAVGRRRKGWATLFSVCALAALAAGLGCSSSSSTVTGATSGTGTYTITVTGNGQRDEHDCEQCNHYGHDPLTTGSRLILIKGPPR